MWVMRAVVSWWRAVLSDGVSGRVVRAWGDSISSRWVMRVWSAVGRGSVGWEAEERQVLQMALPCAGSKRVGWGASHWGQQVS